MTGIHPRSPRQRNVNASGTRLVLDIVKCCWRLSSARVSVSPHRLKRARATSPRQECTMLQEDAGRDHGDRWERDQAGRPFSDTFDR